MRYNRWDRDQIVSFVPPDGKFELMRYRVLGPSLEVTRQSRVTGLGSTGSYLSLPVPIPIFCQYQLIPPSSSSTHGRIDLTVGVRTSCSLIFPKASSPSSNQFELVEDVEVAVLFNKSVKTVNPINPAGMTGNNSQCLFDESTKV